MAKAIENAQRDLNIAFVNEIAMMCGRLGISSKEVFDAAKTKWNFLQFKPGLVGGHCIGVDPYYLVEKAQNLGMETQVITAGRSVNDGMGKYAASCIAGALKNIDKPRTLVLGLTFKENVPDTRNSKSGDVITSLSASGLDAEAHDPHFSPEEIKKMGFAPGKLGGGNYDALVFLVPHREYFENFPMNLLSSLKKGGLFYDLKSIAGKKNIENEGYRYLAL